MKVTESHLPYERSPRCFRSQHSLQTLIMYQNITDPYQNPFFRKFFINLLNKNVRTSLREYKMGFYHPCLHGASIVDVSTIRYRKVSDRYVHISPRNHFLFRVLIKSFIVVEFWFWKFLSIFEIAWEAFISVGVSPSKVRNVWIFLTIQIQVSITDVINLKNPAI